MAHFIDNLWRQVFRGATNREGLEVTLDVVFGEAKVSQFDVAVCSD